MDRDELHDRIRRLLFVSPALASAFAAGGFRSVFRGRGLDFEALREYAEGDDARLIDWNVTVRHARAFVRTYREDRSLTLFLLVDVSASMDAGSRELAKRDQAVLAASLLAYAAQLRGMPVGALFFASGPVRLFEPRAGKSHALALIEAASTARAAPEPRAPTDLAGAMATARRLLKRRSLVMLVSDFDAAAWETELSLLARKHDVVALRITDPLDLALPANGGFELADAEGGGRAWFALSSRGFRCRWEERGRAQAAACRTACVQAGVPLLDIDTHDDPARKLLAFFTARRKL